MCLFGWEKKRPDIQESMEREPKLTIMAGGQGSSSQVVNLGGEMGTWSRAGVGKGMVDVFRGQSSSSQQCKVLGPGGTCMRALLLAVSLQGADPEAWQREPVRQLCPSLFDVVWFPAPQLG